ncbi:MAG: ASCH domain-containing protein [Clostridia bacterium]|nr:ASCH domain-containing protein [Clostridia bacterium]
MKEKRTEMRLCEGPFEQIESGEKTVEVRLYDLKRRKIRVGSYVRFIHAEDAARQISARVVALHLFPSFAELFSSKQFGKCGFNGASIEDAVKRMYTFYTPEEEERWGVVGIELKLSSD